MDWDYFIVLCKKQNDEEGKAVVQGNFAKGFGALRATVVNMVLSKYKDDEYAALELIDAFAYTAKTLVVDHFSENGGAHDEPSNV